MCGLIRKRGLSAAGILLHVIQGSKTMTGQEVSISGLRNLPLLQRGEVSSPDLAARTCCLGI